MSEKQCVRCGRVGHDSAECKWLSADSVNKPPLDVLAQLDLAETEVINAKAWSAGEQAKKHCDFALTAIAVARQAIAAAEQAEPVARDGYVQGIEDAAMLCQKEADELLSENRFVRNHEAETKAETASKLSEMLLAVAKDAAAQPPAVAHVPMQVAGKEDQAVYDSIAACYHQSPAVAVPDGYALVPIDPTEEQWGGLARDIMMAFDLGGKSPASLLANMRLRWEELPEWMRKELHDPESTAVLSKGTRAVLIYRAMLAASPQAAQPPAADQQLELERGTLLAETERKQQLQGQVEQLVAALAEATRLIVELPIAEAGIEATEESIDKVIRIAREGSAVQRFRDMIAAVKGGQP